MLQHPFIYILCFLSIYIGLVAVSCISAIEEVYNQSSPLFTVTEQVYTSGYLAEELDSAAEKEDQEKLARSEGESDVVLGGLFAVHLPGEDNALCQMLYGKSGVRVQAMIFAINQINKRDDVLQGIRLGYEIWDDCSDHSEALKESLNFVRGRPGSHSCDANQPPVIGIVGTGKSSTSRSVNDLVGLFQIPQISYSATSPILSDKSQFPYFLRTVPSDVNQAKVMADLAEYFNWNYVQIIYTDDDYGFPGALALENEFQARNICISNSQKLNSHSSDEEVFQIIKNMNKSEVQAEVVFTFCQKVDIQRVLEKTLSEELFGLTWIASDSWALELQLVEPYREVLKNMIGISPKSEIDPEFVKYLESLSITENDNNPWYQSTLELLVNCQFEGENNNSCIGNETFAPFVSSIEGPIIDAVRAFAYGLDDMLKSPLCQSENCSEFINILDTTQYLEFIKNTSFEAVNNLDFHFDQAGDPAAKYAIHVLQETEFKEVGEWLTEFGVQFNDTDWGSLPASRCSPDCEPGYMQKLQNSNPSCCWTCLKCEDGYVSSTMNSLTCTMCPDGKRTNENQTACLVNPYTYLDWTDFEGIVLFVITSLGLISTIAVFSIFIKKSETPLVKSTSRELSYCLLVSIAMCFAVTFFLIGEPNRIQCNLLIISLGISFTLYVGTLMIKTNRVSRIFNARKSFSIRTSRFLSNKYQFATVFAMLLIQVGIQIVWVVQEPATVMYIQYEKSTSVECNYGTYIGPVITIGYILILAILCFYQAFKIRKLPEQFNDASYIAFSMLTNVLIWCIFFPAYFTSKSQWKLVIGGLAFIFNGIAALGFMFVPKIWIIYFRPEKNVRQSTIATTMKTTRLKNSPPRSSPALSMSSSVPNSRRSTFSKLNTPRDSPEGSPNSIHLTRAVSTAIAKFHHKTTNHQNNYQSKDNHQIIEEDQEINRLKKEINQMEIEKSRVTNIANSLLDFIKNLEFEYREDVKQLFYVYEKGKQELFGLVKRGIMAEKELQEVITQTDPFKADISFLDNVMVFKNSKARDNYTHDVNMKILKRRPRNESCCFDEDK